MACEHKGSKHVTFDHRLDNAPPPTKKKAGYHPATAWLPPATIGNRGVANPGYL